MLHMSIYDAYTSAEHKGVKGRRDGGFFAVRGNRSNQAAERRCSGRCGARRFDVEAGAPRSLRPAISVLDAPPVGRVVFAGGEPGDRSGRMPWISQGGPLDRAGAGAYMPLPLRRAGEITSCKSGAVELAFLFCVGFGAHQSKSFGGPVFRGHWRLRFDL